MVRQRFANDTREHILNILFRLEADASLVGDSVVCPELEHAITSVLKSIPESSIESTVEPISPVLGETYVLTIFRCNASA